MDFSGHGSKTDTTTEKNDFILFEKLAINQSAKLIYPDIYSNVIRNAIFLVWSY